ncbi:uncharacterized protein [Palaemon carinicauda]|uniref:uncharacterized protein n=1 Tax=Palaemon carinicauda TaxID=392227 RepID=UPI0035B6199F
MANHCMALVDYEKAFVTVKTSVLLNPLQRQGIDESYVRTLEDIYPGSAAILKLHIVEKFRQRKELDRETPSLLNNSVLRNLDWENLGININGKYPNSFRFADDIVLFSESCEELQKIIEDLHRKSRNVRLKMNMNTDLDNNLFNYQHCGMNHERHNYSSIVNSTAETRKNGNSQLLYYNAWEMRDSTARCKPLVKETMITCILFLTPENLDKKRKYDDSCKKSIDAKNLYSQLHDEMETSKEEMNSSLTKLVLELAQETGGEVLI